MKDRQHDRAHSARSERLRVPERALGVAAGVGEERGHDVGGRAGRAKLAPGRSAWWCGGRRGWRLLHVAERNPGVEREGRWTRSRLFGIAGEWLIGAMRCRLELWPRQHGSCLPAIFTVTAPRP